MTCWLTKSAQSLNSFLQIDENEEVIKKPIKRDFVRTVASSLVGRSKDR